MKKSDIVWYNSQTGETQIWFMDGHRIVSRGTVVDESGNFIPIGLPFSIVGVGDMNGDGKADLFGTTAKRAKPKSGSWTVTG
jgi:hypothetical protein